MSDNENYEVETTSSGAAGYENVQTSTIKKGSYMIIKDRPCKVLSVSTSKPGKHGSAKCNISAVDIFTGKRIDEISQAHATVQKPNVYRKEYEVTYVDEDLDDTIDVLDETVNETVSFKIPVEQRDSIKEMYDTLQGDEAVLVTILSCPCKEDEVKVEKWEKK